jgi:hypothetical protein
LAALIQLKTPNRGRKSGFFKQYEPADLIISGKASLSRFHALHETESSFAPEISEHIPNNKL